MNSPAIFEDVRDLIKHLKMPPLIATSAQCRQTDAKSGQNHLAVANSVFDDASQSAVVILYVMLGVSSAHA